MNGIEKYCCQVDSNGQPIFTRVDQLKAFPHRPENATLGVLVRDKVNHCVFFVPCDGSFFLFFQNYEGSIVLIFFARRVVGG